MSRILRRPMFRGGRVDSRGTGITSGLAGGGRVGYQSGGSSFIPIGQTRGQISAAQQAINQMYGVPEAGDYKPNVRGQSGGNIFSRAMSKVRNVPYLGRLIPSGSGIVGTFASRLALPAAIGTGIGQAADFITRATDTPEAYQFRKDATKANPFLFDETSTDEFIEFSEELSKLDKGENQDYIRVVMINFYLIKVTKRKMVLLLRKKMKHQKKKLLQRWLQ